MSINLNLIASNPPFAPLQDISFFLAAAITDNQLSFVASYEDMFNGQTVNEGTVAGVSNNTTPVVIINYPQKIVNGITSPTAGVIRKLTFLSITNLDIAPATVTLNIDSITGGQGAATSSNIVTQQLISITLQTNYTLTYQNGFKVLDANGVIQVSNSSSVIFGTVENDFTPLPNRPLLNFYSGILANDNTLNLSSDITLSNTGVVAGSYGGTYSILNIAVDYKGRISAITELATSPGAIYTAGIGLSLAGTAFSLISPVANTLGGTGGNSSGATGVAQVSAGIWSYSTALVNGTTATTQSPNDASNKVATTEYVDIYYALQSLTDGATITWNVSMGLNASVTLGGNRTLSITNAKAGYSGNLVVTQDATGSRTLAITGKVVGLGSGSIILSTAASAIDILSFYYDGTTFFWTYGNSYS